MKRVHLVAQPLRWIARQEGVAIFLALAMVLATWGFVKVTGEIFEEDTRAFDEQVLRLFRDPDDPAHPIGPGWLKEAARDVTAMGGEVVLVLVLVAVVGYLALERLRHAMWLVAIAAGGGLFLSTLLKHVVARERPDVVPHLVTVATASFPSGHSMLSAVAYLTLGALLAQISPRKTVKVYFLSLAVLLTLLVGLSRVFLGVHYPTDVLAGWSAGLAWALLCWLVARSLQRRGAIENPGNAPD